MKSLLKKLGFFKKNIPVGESLEIFVPYAMYIGAIKGSGSGGLVGYDISLLRDDYAKLDGYRGLFKVISSCDGGYKGGAYVQLARESPSGKVKREIKRVRVYGNVISNKAKVC